MIITAGGDSFIFGSELADCRNDSFLHCTNTPSESSFTALLTQGYNYNCVAWPGYANDSIARTVIEACESINDQQVVIVSWTFPGRYEFRFNYNTRQLKSPWYAFNSWTIKDVASIEAELTHETEYNLLNFISNKERADKTGVAEFAQTFYHHVGSSEYWEIYSTIKEIVYLQNYLKVKQIPYLFTCADNSIFVNHTIQEPDTVITSLYNQIDHSNWFWFPPGMGANQTETPRGFYQWAVENKYSMGTTHPLEQAHTDAAKLMQGKFNELVTKHIL